MSMNVRHSAEQHTGLRSRAETRPGALLIFGVVGGAILVSCSLAQALHGERVLLSTYIGVALLLVCLLTATIGFARIIDWTDPFPADDRDRPEVRTFDDEDDRNADVSATA